MLMVMMIMIDDDDDDDDDDIDNDVDGDDDNDDDDDDDHDDHDYDDDDDDDHLSDRLLRLSFNSLNEHRFRHNFDCLDHVCLCGIANEDSRHFLVHCPIFEEARRGLLRSLSNIPRLDIAGMDTKSLYHVIPFWKSRSVPNSMIMEATINFIKATKRFD